MPRIINKSIHPNLSGAYRIFLPAYEIDSTSSGLDWPVLDEEYDEWCEENLTGDWEYTFWEDLRFELEEDMLLFKLTFGDQLC